MTKICNVAVRWTRARWHWLLLGMWAAYSGAALAWLHLAQPPFDNNYCVSSRR